MPARDDEGSKVLPFPVPLSLAQIVEAVARSPDGGTTLFLSKLSLSDIGANEATELALAGRTGRQETDSVVERLALGNNRLTTLPTEFALLTHLRYLNLRHNSFVSFPDVLTIMPSLDTLDISYNKLKRLPPYPGNLTRLKVFSLSRNKLTKLPSYLTQFRHLEVLQVDRNPIDWPPAAVLEAFGDPQDVKNGKEWVRKLQTWVDTELSKGKEFEDSGYSEKHDLKSERSYYESWRFPVQDKTRNATAMPHSRSFSVDSDMSTSSVSILNPANDVDNKQIPPLKRRPLNLTTNTKPLSQPYDLAEVLSASYTPSSVLANQSNSLPEPEAIHLRAASHAGPLRKPQSPAVPSKKSLPDLRTTRRHIPTLVERPAPSVLTIPDDASIHQDSGSSYGSLPPAYDEDVHPPNLRITPLVSVERSSYFRRSSIIPTNHFPQALRVLLLSARGILFALGQLYQTLDQYVHQDGNERLSTVFRKVLEPANVTMLHLIRSLDRFDDVGQKSTPSPAVCRALVESCRDTVTIFRKAVGLVASQLGPGSYEDVRYVRWLILELYAASAELSHAWQSLVSQLESLKPFLSSSFLKAPSFGTLAIADNSSPTAADQSVRLRSIEVAQGGRTHTARRHAGSFSTKDVQIGKELPSYDVVPSMAGGLASDSQTPTLRTPKRQVTLPVITSTPNSSSFSFNAPPYPGSFSDSAYHHRGHSQSSITEGAGLSAPAILHDSSLAAKAHIEKEVLQAVQRTVDIAPAVWDQIEEALGNLAVSNQDIHENIEQARSVTKRLSDDVVVMSEGYSDADKRLFRENAHLFLKSLVLLSNVLKAYTTPRSVPSSLRANLVTLTHCTEEFAIPLHIPSVPSYTPRSYSPISNAQYAPYNATLHIHEDGQLPAGLSRSRSEQPTLRSTSTRQPLSSPHSGTAPLLTGRTPGVRRMRLPREFSTENTDPG